MVPGRPVGTLGTVALIDVCPTGALFDDQGAVGVDLGRCIHCMRCRQGTGIGIKWAHDVAWAQVDPWTRLPGASFRHSLHVKVVDAGDCGACLREIKQLTSPYYAVHRLGIFFTPTPRDADVLMVVGVVTQGMRHALQATYDALPDPKWVVAVGSEAVTGVPFGPSFAASGGVQDLLPVALTIPGCPPPPLTILDGLLRLMGRGHREPVDAGRVTA
jgi:Ni,Fe-hydrogenase III small subunit